ncbi:hypothetical protein MLD38_012435 [Melastoma candidum]|uniref:Uncharacterized protein n=1 Tax=Melastoma candidum TaxID=119954 RepID=A0ACB9R839_9MYRT|nr:hypothetical protein MLD38_012435 [Melastoma candidum]
MNDSKQDVIHEIRRECSQIITFSHFIPRQELCPDKRMLFGPYTSSNGYVQAPLASYTQMGNSSPTGSILVTGRTRTTVHPREPHNTELAPWVAIFYSRRSTSPMT